MRFSVTFLFLNEFKLKFDTGIQNWMLILIFGSKSGFGDDFGEYDAETIILRHRFGQTPLRNSVPMATPKVPGDQKLFERVFFKSIPKVTKFQHLTTSELRYKEQLGGGGKFPTPSKIGLILYLPMNALKGVPLHAPIK